MGLVSLQRARSAHAVPTQCARSARAVRTQCKHFAILSPPMQREWLREHVTCIEHLNEEWESLRKRLCRKRHRSSVMGLCVSRFKCLRIPSPNNGVSGS